MVVALLLRLGCAALLAWIGYIHLHLWQEGYRQIPTNGPLFLLDAVGGFALAAVLLIWPRPLAGLLAAGYTCATLGAQTPVGSPDDRLILLPFAHRTPLSCHSRC